MSGRLRSFQVQHLRAKCARTIARSDRQRQEVVGVALTACLLAGQTGQARDLARRSLKIAHDGGHRNGEAGALHVLAKAAAHDGLLEQALRHYTDALAIAEKHEMRPLAARVRHGLGEVYLLMAEQNLARENLVIAVEMYRQMGMWFWIEAVNGTA